MQDRERFLALPQVPDTQHSINPKNPPNPPPGASGTSGILTSSATSVSGTLKVCVLLRLNKNEKKKFFQPQNYHYAHSRNQY